MRAALVLYSFFSRIVTGVINAFYDRGWLRPRHAPLPVVSIGNIALGGTGKTPMAMEILSRLLDDGFRPALVTRGYRGRWEKRGGVLSDGKALCGDWKDGGDEPFLAAVRIPRAGVFVGRNRLSSCFRAAEMGFDVAVLDDGFQHRKLRRDLDVVLFDPGNTAALREPPSALNRADIVLFPESAREGALSLLGRSAPRPLACAFSVVPLGFRKMNGPAGENEPLAPPERFRGSRAMAFCGLAGPERFFRTLEQLGLRLLEKRAFPDHHGYPSRTWAWIRDRCRALKPDVVVTTEKDAVKLAGRSGVPGAVPLFALRIGVVFQESACDALIGSVRRAAGGVFHG
ncbi:MAG: tetraacyldisaccharide 4'-kinase [Candidatus Aminicenantes bacterium]|nr:tetraacyldisaccharide 4'-kinase [Candidatus Aminicenantes bacterium]